MHGFALNCDVDLAGTTGSCPAASPTPASPRLSAELGRDVTVPEVAPVVERHLRDLLAWAPYDPDAGLPGQARTRPAPRSP